MYKAYQSSFNIKKYFIFLKTTHIYFAAKGLIIFAKFKNIQGQGHVMTLIQDHR